MGTISNLLGTISSFIILLLAAYIVLAEPLLRTNFYRNLKKQLKTDPNARLLFYRIQVVWEWSWVVVLVLILIPIADRLDYLGLTLPSTYGWIILAALLLGIVLSVFLIRRNPSSLAAMQKNLEASSYILPGTASERRWYAAMAVTMGICEELLYRGFFLRFLTITFPGMDFIIVCIIGGVVYGLSRAYLGGRGVITASITGFSYGIIYYLSGNLLFLVLNNQQAAITVSLIPGIIFHIVSELRTLLLWQPGEQKKPAR